MTDGDLKGDKGEDPFVAAILGDDELGAVMRSHLHIEYHLSRLFELAFPRTKYLEQARLEYHEKVHIAVAAGLLRENLLTPLKALGELRNKMAHRLNFKITDGVVNDLVNTMSSYDRTAMQYAYERTNRKLPSENRPKRITRLSSRDRFTLFVVVLRMALVHQEAQLKTAM